jgi:cation transport ATPase
MIEPEPSSTPADDVEKSQQDFDWGRVIGAFLLTLLAIPFLFAVTCVPVGFVAIAAREPYVVPIFVVYGVLFVGFGIYKAVRTDNIGMRWAIIATLIAAAISAATVFVPVR